MKDMVAALGRDLEEYKQPKNQNLITGEELDPRATEAEKLAILSQSYSQPQSTQEVRSFCVNCTSRNVAEARAKDPMFDPTIREHLEGCLAWGDHTEDEGCVECSWRLHPNLQTPTPCRNCKTLLNCRGRLFVCCPSCRVSFTGGKDEHISKLLAGRAQSGDSAQRDADNQLYHYIRLTGGESLLFGNARDVSAARLKLRELCGSFFQESRDYRITPRIVLFGATLTFSAYPDGRDGLAIRDFIPHRSMIFQALSGHGRSNDTAEGREPTGDGRGRLDLSMFDDSGEWSNLPPHERLGDWVTKHMPVAPNYPVNLGPDTWLAQEGVFKLALSNMGQFLIDCGVNRAWEVRQTEAELCKLSVGTYGLSLPDLEHTACITPNSFYCRLKSQSEDFSRSQLYAFECEEDGWAVRYFYAPTLPKIIQMIRMPKEVSQTHQAACEVYSGRYNQGGMSLSHSNTTAPSERGKKQKSKKSSWLWLSHPQDADGGAEEATHKLHKEITWQPGGAIGDRLPEVNKYKHLTTVAADGQEYCISYQSKSGCPYEEGPEGVACRQTNLMPTVASSNSEGYNVDGRV